MASDKDFGNLVREGLRSYINHRQNELESEQKMKDKTYWIISHKGKGFLKHNTNYRLDAFGDIGVLYGQAEDAVQALGYGDKLVEVKIEVLKEYEGGKLPGDLKMPEEEDDEY